MLKFIQGNVQVLRWTCIVASLGAAISALAILAENPRDRVGPLLMLLIAVLNGGTLLMLGGGDHEERRLQSKLRKQLLQLRIKEVEYHLDPRPGLAPTRDADRRRQLLEANW